MAIIIRYVNSLYIDDQLFHSLLIGIYAKFNLLIQNVNHIHLGNNLFLGLEQAEYSEFYFQLNKIGRSSSFNDNYEVDDKVGYTMTSQENTFYASYYEDDAMYEDENDLQVWFCLPEGLFKNVKQSESSSAQFHFIQMTMSINVATDSFTGIQMNQNSKVQVLFESIEGHIIFDAKSVHLITLSEGTFEIWIEDIKEMITNDIEPSIEIMPTNIHKAKNKVCKI